MRRRDDAGMNNTMFRIFDPRPRKGRRMSSLLVESLDGERDRSFRRFILAIPPGKVSTYGKVAAAAGYPRYHRAVARLLRTDPPDQLPWHRVVGAGGVIKLPGIAAQEQKARLKAEGIRFKGELVDIYQYEYDIHPWEIPD